ncbi:MAG: hypothetical protein ACLQSR_16330, partial [Limisphaerales bacterium]
MTQKIITIFITLGVLFVLIGFLQLEWRNSRSMAFFKTVSKLPRSELVDYSSRCGSLYTNFYNADKLITITNKEVLGQFVLLGKSPEFIGSSTSVMGKGEESR